MPATVTELVVSTPAGMPRGSLPKVNSATFSSTMPSATVAISQAFEPRRTNGRTAMRSTMTPHARSPRAHRMTARPSGQCRVTQKVKQSTAPSIIALPWAKFTVLETAWVTWKPSASSPYMLPSPSPEIIAALTSMARLPSHTGRGLARVRPAPHQIAPACGQFTGTILSPL